MTSGPAKRTARRVGWVLAALAGGNITELSATRLDESAFGPTPPAAATISRLTNGLRGMPRSSSMSSMVAGHRTHRSVGQARALQLEEVAAVTLPDELEILGGVLAEDGSALLWGTTGVWTHKIGREVTRHCRDLRLAPLEARRGRAVGDYELYDVTSASVVRLSGQDPCAVRTVHAGLDIAHAVTPVSNGWAEITRLSPEQLAVRFLPQSDQDSVIVRIPVATPLRFARVVDYAASAVRESVLLTEIAFPFRTLQIDRTNGIRLLADPAAQLTTRERREVLRGWESLKIVPLDRGYVQILADPRSDRRLILVLDALGQIARRVELDVAMGVLDADPHTRMLLAVRNVGRRELVYYRWHWRGSHKLQP